MQRDSHLNDCPLSDTNAEPQTEEHDACADCDAKAPGSNGSNGANGGGSMPRTLTGTIRAFRDSGSFEMVEYLDEVRETRDHAERLMKLLKKLRKRKTADYPKLQPETAAETS